jgi:predicted TIM-barrel fold metal-dependent hydrolase
VLGRLLHDHANLYVDLSLGHPDFMKEAFGYFDAHADKREELRALIEEHADRFLFGTDLVFTDHPQKNRAWLDTTAGGYFGWLGAKKLRFGLPSASDFAGLALSAETRKKIYSDNFREVFLGGGSLGDGKDEPRPNPKGLEPGDSDADEAVGGGK